jgi:hypothetical protein
LTVFLTALAKHASDMGWSEETNTQQIALFNIVPTGGTVTVQINIINVCLVLNPDTGCVSPQYHCRVDDFFESMGTQDISISMLISPGIGTIQVAVSGGTFHNRSRVHCPLHGPSRCAAHHVLAQGNEGERFSDDLHCAPSVLQGV